MATVQISISPGDLLDRLTITEIKICKILNPEKREHIEELLYILNAAFYRLPRLEGERVASFNELHDDIKRVNNELWDLEDKIRSLEVSSSFDEQFIETARAIYKTNDRRAMIKNKIDSLFGCNISEQKSFESQE